MCGIAGFYSVANEFSPADLKKMADLIAHRGPDADGCFSEDGVGLAHRRLSIIDLSSEANQPMSSHSAQNVMVYNGEIYNYDEIRREQGIQARTTSDTEIVLELIAKYGRHAFEQFNGMFALAFFNKETKKLTLARDRMGIKPLYYYWDGRNFAFSSEMKCLLAISTVKDKAVINPLAVNEFLHLGFVPAPHSIYKNIYKLDPGHILDFDGSSVTLEPYWQLKDCFHPECIKDEMQAREILRDLVQDSVRYRLRSDVPFGTFLSGGVDSSLVTAVAQRNSNEQLKTFSIGFDDAKHDESQFARKVADYLGTDHHEFRVRESDMKEMLPDLLDVYDEPCADTSAFPTMAVSRMARQHVSMTLSGDGGDEQFMGYGAYAWAEKLSQGYLSSFHKPIGILSGLLNSRYKRVGKLLSYKESWHMQSHIFSQEQYFFTQGEIETLCGNPLSLNFSKADLLDFHRKLTPAEVQAYFDLHYYLPDDLLTKVDRATMRYGLESRVPLLDHNIVEFALNLSPELKMKNGTQKYLLKQVLYDYIPSSFFDRPKWGFSIPLMRWLKADMHYLIDEYLSASAVTSAGLVDPVVVQRLITRFRNGRNDYLYNRIWVLIVLHKFYCER